MRTKKIEPIGGKRSTILESESPRIELKLVEKFVAKDLDERLIAEVTKRVRGV